MVPGSVASQTPSAAANESSSPTISEEQHFLDLAYQIQRANRATHSAVEQSESSESSVSIITVETAPESLREEEEAEPVRELGQIDRLNLTKIILKRNKSRVTGEANPRKHETTKGSMADLRTLANFHVIETLKKNPKLVEEVSEVAKDAASSLGLLLKDPVIADAFLPVPVTLLPSLTSHHAVHEVLQLQPEINLLMHRVSHDRNFLTQSLAGVSSVDPFIKSLLNIYNQVDIDAQWELDFIRSDYLLHCNDPTLSFVDAVKAGSYKQVEVNMICIAFAGLSSRMQDVHNRVLNFLECDVVPAENAGDVLPLYGGALKLAHGVYSKNFPATGKRQQVLLTVIHPEERNTMDQRMVEFESGLLCLRRTFQQIGERATLDEEGRLLIEGLEVAVVYYRVGYAPPHYASDKDWETRLLIEKSSAIKCPSVAHQLSGFKKIQQELSRPEVLVKFISEKSVRDRMLETCVGQWDVSSSAEEATKHIQKAFQSPELYVLKPNREGGGNNFYDGQLISRLKEVYQTDQAKEFILMERILPPLQENFLVRPQKPTELLHTVSEIGIFGVIIARGDEIICNAFAKDILVRTKASTVGEGGVATGYACLSSAIILKSA
ncbi:Glutathione synthetase [Hypsibius exemplaris]|uniref:Glutathione synthetase n=1 Tax=Hypsibius exemplaris TaxID=2072580 RepID=A0A1W0WZN2_HYPEX|nr:Glutathione synthetase [Hypsibius exemplaris]